MQIRRVTLDTGCVNAKRKNEELNLLERWAQEGKLVLQRSDVMLRELAGDARREKAGSLAEHPELFTLGISQLGGPDVLAGPDLGPELQEVLFPTASHLTRNQQNDVEHLRLHVRTGGHVFLTLNKNDFITLGRQDVLRACGIWVMRPLELVELLQTIYGWS